jgi:hypothetical protein
MCNFYAVYTYIPLIACFYCSVFLFLILNPGVNVKTALS